MAKMSKYSDKPWSFWNSTLEEIRDFQRRSEIGLFGIILPSILIWFFLFMWAVDKVWPWVALLSFLIPVAGWIGADEYSRPKHFKKNENCH